MTKTTKTDSTAELALVIVAAGSSTRFNAGGKERIKKEYLPLDTEETADGTKGGTVLSAAAKIFLRAKDFSTLAIAYPSSPDKEQQQENEKAAREALFSDEFFSSPTAQKTETIFVPGGETRQKSVKNALEEISRRTAGTERERIVFIHDGARPFLKAQTIEDTLEAALEYGAAVPGLQPTDTQKERDEDGFIRKHLVRSALSAVQTPQVFHLDEILEGHRRAEESGAECTDDTEIWDRFVVPFSNGKFKTVKIVEGDPDNIKITYKSDLAPTAAERKMIRIGIGYDKHILVDSAQTGRKLWLGGVEIPSDKGEDGHSDGDALLHAITDALLGASALGDIGSYFPPSDMKWKGADSKVLLETCWNDVKKEGWKLGNIDCVIALEKPKFLPHRDEVRASIAKILGCGIERVFVKAKTGEKTGDVGQRKVVEVWCTCLLER